MNIKSLYNLSNGMYIISTKYENHFAGCIVNTVTQATPEERPKLIVIVNKENDTAMTMQKSKITEKSVSYIECNIINEIDCSTHIIFILEATNAEVLNEEEVMTYEYYHKVVKGKTPPKASSYNG